MKFFCFAFVVAFSSFVLHSKVVNADKVVLFAFNNGVSPSATTCSQQDNSKIDLVFFFAPAARARRNLRSGSVDVMANVTSDSRSIDHFKHTSVSRNLTTSSKCKNVCAGYATGTCRAAGCQGIRRELNDESNDSHDRKLQTDKCNAAITFINNGLNDLITTNAISSSCQSFIAASKRTSSCFDDPIYGKIEAIKFWDVAVASSPRLLSTFAAESMPFSMDGWSNLQSGFSFCQSQKITVEAVANECVEVVQFHMYKEKNSFHELVHTSYTYSKPFSLYGINTSNQMQGSNLPAGQYVIDTKPNWWVARERRFVFTVSNC